MKPKKKLCVMCGKAGPGPLVRGATYHLICMQRYVWGGVHAGLVEVHVGAPVSKRG